MTMLVEKIALLIAICVLTADVSCGFVLDPSMHQSTSLASTLEGDDVGGDGTIIWQMKRDKCDEWLDRVLIERSSDAPTIFSVASSVVEGYMSNANTSSPLLRRVPYCHDDFGVSTTQQSGDEQFEPLFGIYSNENDIGLVSPTRFSKKNRKRTNLKLAIAYRGQGFCGWEDQRHELYRNRSNSNNNSSSTNNADQPLPSVQGTLADILGPVIGNSPTNTKPIEIKVAGRTDRGVSAIGQVCRVRTWNEIPNVEAYVQELVNREAVDNDLGLRITNVEQVGPDFHPSFGASSRSYVYLIDLDLEDDTDDEETPGITRDLVPRLDRMLRELEGKELDYFALSHGKVKTQTTFSTLYHSKVSIVEYIGGDEHKRQALCFELVGNRFLRRMVRLLVGTALREAYRGGEDDSLKLIILSKDRRERSRAAPPDGLMFVRAET
ncbi:tRNA pseudouridine synthase [Skeletonema marinoi]|uniref:tRNA pseudouridine synthase n=1 Tax=Skeletonema marinoi TaxID=267567 RepID=A0AAD8YLL1_9STRA|nr:tRNA pseudouridine synthase [Skeletonema marinoi]